MKILLTTLFLSFHIFSSAQVIDESLLLYLPFNGNANDESGNNNHGTVTNATLTNDRNGNPNSAYNFNGSSSVIQIPASASLSKIYTSNEITISAWVNIRNWFQGWNVFPIFEQYNPNTDFGSTLLEANWASGGILFVAGYNTGYIECGYNWNFNQWHQITLTYSTITDLAKFYIDGNLICTKPYSQDFTPDNTNSYTIGRSLSGPDEWSDGMIDELKIYSRALSDNEIANLPLPINLLNFKAQSIDNQVNLTWKTSNETNFSHFEIQRSTPLTPGGGISIGKFEKIGKVDGNNETNYMFNDWQAPLLGAGGASEGLFYRLKLIDLDGKHSYSKIISIQNETKFSFNIYPNPVIDNLNISANVKESGNYQIQILDEIGQVKISQNNFLKAGQNQISIPANSFQKGIYFAVIQGDIGINKVLKFLK